MNAPQPTFRKYRDGDSGPYTEEYHHLLGRTPWIVIRRLLRGTVPAYEGSVNGSLNSGSGPNGRDGPSSTSFPPPVLSSPTPSSSAATSLLKLSPPPQSAAASVSSPRAREELSEGDVATVFSQFGEVVDVRMVRHRKTGRPLGTAFVRFADFRSGIVAADEMNSHFEKGELICLTPFTTGVEGQQELRTSFPSSSGAAAALSTASGPLENGQWGTSAPIVSGIVRRGAGIIVERVDEHEVPEVYSASVQTYPQWVSQCRKRRRALTHGGE